MKSLSLKLQQIEESQTLAFTARARQMREQGIQVVSLTAGEPDFPTPPHVKMAAVQAIEENFTHYTASEGIPELRKAIQAKFKRDNGLTFEMSEILVSCGAKHSIFNALQAICNRGDEVVIPAPYWVSYPEMVKLVDAKPVIVTGTAENKYKITARQLRQAVNDRTKALLLNSPSNPTGAVYSQGELEELAGVVEQTGIYVIADEIYEKILYDGASHFSIGNIREIADQVITVNGMSKAYAMTGWRLGYLGARRQIVEGAAKVQSQTTSNATSIAQRAGVAALAGPQADVVGMVAEFKRRRDFVLSELSTVQGLRIVAPRGAFYLFPDVSQFVGKRINGQIIRNDMDLCFYFLNEQHVALVPGGAFGGPNHLRMSYACSMRELQEAVDRLKDGFKKLQEAY
jgi:aspartate aminotransferase